MSASSLDTGMWGVFQQELTAQLPVLMKDDYTSERARISLRGMARLVGLPDVAALLDEPDLDVQAVGPWLQELAQQDAAGAEAWLAGQQDVLSRWMSPVQTPPPLPLPDGMKEWRGDETTLLDQSPSAAMMKHEGLLELFLEDLHENLTALEDGLLRAEENVSAEKLQRLMRTAHSIKGAARIAGIASLVELAHAMEDIFSAAMERRIDWNPAWTDILLGEVDFLKPFASKERAHALLKEVETLAPEFRQRTARARELLEQVRAAPIVEGAPPPVADNGPDDGFHGVENVQKRGDAGQSLSISTEILNRLTQLAGHVVVESKQLQDVIGQAMNWKQQIADLESSLKHLEESVSDIRNRTAPGVRERVYEAVANGHDVLDMSTRFLTRLRDYAAAAEASSIRLYSVAQETRMRPIQDMLRVYPRMVRDLARDLQKNIALELVGGLTKVDRDVLGKLDAPLTHLLRNACDHGIESAEERERLGKPPRGVIRISCSHRAGWLWVEVADDGRGIDVERIRQVIQSRNLVTGDMAAQMGEEELQAFLFLPGFTLKGEVSEVSGRGVGLDVVQSMVRDIGGSITVLSTPEKGTRFELRLPLSLSLQRGLVVRIGGEAYVFPLGHVDRVRYAGTYVEEDGREGVMSGDVFCPRVDTRWLWRGGAEPQHAASPDDLLVLLRKKNDMCAFVVDEVTGERDLVVLPLDERLGPVPGIHAATILADGEPALILDTDDLLKFAFWHLSGEEGALAPSTAPAENARAAGGPRRRILVVEDSPTVREVERRLLEKSGYDVFTAVDGVDGLNYLQAQPFDLLISDVDMPRMDGVEMIAQMRQNPMMKAMPVMVISYKDRDEDRMRALRAGANAYLTKGNFQDDYFVNMVHTLLGNCVQ